MLPGRLVEMGNEVWHLAPDCGLAALGEAGATGIHLFRDNLALGPCHVRLPVHIRLRLNFYRSWGWGSERDKEGRGLVEPAVREVEKEFVRVESLGAEIVRDRKERAIVVWSTPSWPDRLFLWWVLNWLQSLGLPSGRLFLAEPAQPRHRGAGAAALSLGSFDAGVLFAAASQARPIDRAGLWESGSLWRAYCAPSPRVFAARVRRGSRAFPELGTLGRAIGDWMPRAAPLRCSPLDELLLAGFSTDEWRRPIDVIAAGGSDWIERILLPYGDAIIGLRLEAWLRHRRSAGAVLEGSRPGGAALAQAHYRLTRGGRRLLVDGMSAVDDGPPICVGGATFYDSRRPWLQTGGGDDWSVGLAGSPETVPRR